MQGAPQKFSVGISESPVTDPAADILSRLAARLANKRIGLLLCGGGFKGSYQIGAWKALREVFKEFEVIAGTSVDALNAMLIGNQKPEAAERVWNEMNVMRFSPRGIHLYAGGYALLFGPMVLSLVALIFSFFCADTMDGQEAAGMLLSISAYLAAISFILGMFARVIAASLGNLT